ncbi:MAG: gfo/Idh/MocA family oxidoreductase, partial [Thermoleophilia bacterium]|nr:gfo/Idh/MocA family oxidoreductase [Thermoleophilia bacterium]
LRLGDPNCFSDDIVLLRPEDGTEVVETRDRQPDLERGLGVADLVDAIQEGHPHRASSEMAGHVLDVMLAVTESAAKGRHVTVASSCERPAPLEAERIRGWLAER